MTSLLSVTANSTIELISSFASGPGQIQASESDNWQVIGGAFKNNGDAKIRLNINALITNPSCNGSVRVYDISDTVPSPNYQRIVNVTNIPGSIFSQNGAPKSIYSNTFSVRGNRIYVVQVKLIGDPDPENIINILNIIPENAE